MQTKNRHFAAGLFIGVSATAVLGVPWNTASAVTRPMLASDCYKAYEVYASSGNSASFMITSTETYRQQSGWSPLACSSLLTLPRGSWRVELGAHAEALCMNTCEARIFFSEHSTRCIGSCEPTTWSKSPTWEHREIHDIYEVACKFSSCRFPLQLQLNQEGATVDALGLMVRTELTS